MRLIFVVSIVLAMTVSAPTAPGDRTFADVTASAGIQFRHQSGAAGKKFLPETMGSGGAFLDADGDGWLDVLLVNSMGWPGGKTPHTRHALYRNNGNGTFTDVTAVSGLGSEMYGMGVAAADYDNDGKTDVYITGLGGNRLFHGAGGGKFVDVTAKAGVAAGGFSTSAVWFDYDNDGKLDLFVARYVEWSADKDLYCTLDGKSKSYCTPESYKGASGFLFHNRGDGTFEDVTKAAGLYDSDAKALGVALLDFDNDGALDLFVANDTQPNRLYRNRKNGTFVDVGTTAGVAFNEAGVARAGMGVDAADFDGSGRPSVVIGNFSNEMIALYHNEDGSLFLDEAANGAIGRASALSLTFSCFFFDYDLDGRPDIFAANGHVADDINKAQPKITYAQAPLLFRNAGNKRFDVADGGAALKAPIVARGAAHGDIDLDGDPDIVVTTNNGPAKLLRNDGGSRGHALRLTLVGVASNRSAIGARVRVSVEGRSMMQMVKTGSSYLSQSELPLTFGLGTLAKIEKAASIEIEWPSGKSEKIRAVDADQQVTIREGQGIVQRAALIRK